MGQIRKRGNVYWIRYYRNGRRFEESARTAKYDEARDLLRTKEGDISKGVPVSPKAGRLTFEEASKDFINDYTVNKRRALEHVQRRVTLALEPAFGGRRMAQITTSDVRAYIADRQTAGAANATINRELAALKRMYSLALQAGKLLHRPYIPMLKERNARQGFFERAQFNSVCDHLSDALRAIATFAYVTGWRTRSEVLPLQWHQIDRKAGIVRLEPNTTKNDEGREFVYADIPELKETIDRLWAEHERLRLQGRLCPDVFVRFKGKRAGQRIKSWRRSWLTACKQAGCPGRIPHDFRRTAIRNLVRAGVSEQIAMRMSGHKTRSVFDRYDIVSNQDLREAGRKLGAALSGTIAGTMAANDASAAKQTA